MAEKSEFGRGLAICLVKFAEHFENDMARQIGDAHFFYDELKGNKTELEKYGADIKRNVEHFERFYLEITGSVERGLSCKTWSMERGLSRLIETWANGASDHLYEIEVPKHMAKTKLGRLVGRLQSKGLRMGHGFTGEIHTYADFTELRELTRKIALELDKKMGLKPDLGKW